jgi:hypothetical protein
LVLEEVFAGAKIPPGAITLALLHPQRAAVLRGGPFRYRAAPKACRGNGRRGVLHVEAPDVGAGRDDRVDAVEARRADRPE